ncbi:MAG TPA: phosphoglycerate dehydrogenase [Longimicrobiales bacterium]|nr:phosphoglycerate dehydrogenase [Longimicrobiales bacterium]
MSAPYRILFADAIAPEGLEALRTDDRFELVEQPGLTGEDLARAIEGVDAVIVRSATRITRSALQYADRLKVIGRAGVGVDNIDVEAATERGIAVLNAPSGNTISAAELTLALLLAAVRGVSAADRSMKSGEWDRKSFNGRELYGKTLGLVGAGRIGGEVAKRARAFGMRVVAYDPFLAPERARELEIELEPLEEVLRRADVVTLHVPLTESTAGLIDENRLALMKRGAYLVNACRGGVVDEAALLRALETGRLAGAALDVFETEPLPPADPLRRAANVVLTPHLGAATKEAQQNVAVEIGLAVRDALLEGDYSRAVNAPAIGGEEMRRLRPLLELAERLGRLAAACSDGAVQTVEVRYAGSMEAAERPVTSAALVGLLRPALGARGINLVSALHLAQARGIHVRRTRLDARGDYGEYVEIQAQMAGCGQSRVAGALLAEGHPRIVMIDDFPVNVVPSGALVVLRNRDVPGVIGRVGSLLGDAGINIAEYHQSRMEEGGDALAAIRVDGRLPPAVVEALRRVSEVGEVRQVDLS